MAIDHFGTAGCFIPHVSIPVDFGGAIYFINTEKWSEWTHGKITLEELARYCCVVKNVEPVTEAEIKNVADYNPFRR